MPVRLTYGSDPEFFIVKHEDHSSITTLNTENGHSCIIPFYELGLTDGSKDEPARIDESENDDRKLRWLIDGVTCEVNHAPQEDMTSVAACISNAKDKIRLRLRKPGKSGYLGYLSDFTCGAELSKIQLSDPRANVLGCSPDKLAFSNEDRPPLSAEILGNRRFAGRHIHLGVDPWPEDLPKYVAVRFASMIYGHIFGEGSTWRSKFYGIPGLYRETAWGIEMREPSLPWWTYGTNALRRFENCWNAFCRASAGEIAGVDKLMAWHTDMDWEGMEAKFRRDAQAYDAIHPAQADSMEQVSSMVHMLDTLYTNWMNNRLTARVRDAERIMERNNPNAQARAIADAVLGNNPIPRPAIFDEFQLRARPIPANDMIMELDGDVVPADPEDFVEFPDDLDDNGEAVNG